MSQIMPLSFSRLSTFENCPAQFDYVYVSKRVKDQPNEASEYGDRVHKVLEAKGQGKLDPAKLSEEGRRTLEQWGDLVDMVLAKPGDKYFEHQMAVNNNLQPVDWFAKDVWIRSIADVLVVNGDTAYCIDYKGLPLDTWLPTPTGWTTMGDVAVGDTLFAESGEQCTVVGKSEIKHLPCYRVTFDDTSVVTCDEEHLWKLADGDVVNVRALRKNDQIAVAAPLALPDAELPIDPYVLGLWIADGKHSSGEISKPDADVWAEIQRRGYAVDMTTGGAKSCPTRTVKSMRGKLAALGLLGVGTKRIPSLYLRAGYQQRLDLLRGLMDGDGSVNPTRKQCVYSTTNSALSSDVCELLRSLGQRPLRNAVTARGFGKTVEAFPVSFRPLGINPFLLPRKRDRVGNWGPGMSAVRRVVSVEPVASVPTQCIKVDSPDHTFLCTASMIPTHNTGKVKENPTQLQLFAAMVMWHFPEVHTVKTSFIWLKFNETTNAKYERRFLGALWSALKPRFDKVQEVIELGVFKTKPSGLCPWCPAKDICPDARLKKR
jgi:hypothetical protein